MSGGAIALKPYLNCIRATLNAALCLENFGCQHVERYNKPEVEASCVGALRAPRPAGSCVPVLTEPCTHALLVPIDWLVSSHCFTLPVLSLTLSPCLTVLPLSPPQS